ncbi:DUF368 domain-containing protein [Candidatus Roizmanbacteria bacterium]|nr:MAG: DUF368 domain-containing protein [Candidatus Roizmanbacteria bacterium]
MKTQKKTDKPLLQLFVTGFIMGTADLIPGVSGGTVAFVAGIYDELLASIKKVSGEVLRLGLQFKIKEAVAAVPYRFLFPLLAGIFTAILSLANLLGYLLDTYPSFVWAFFFGLVIASTWIVAKRVSAWSMPNMISFITFLIVGYTVVGAVPVETPSNLPMYFLSGMIAICAMILPGISGSFILLIMGKYAQVLGAVREMNIGVLISVALGAVVGLSIFSRFLSWLFAKHHDISVAALSGFMLGSVRKLWPWQEVIETRINSHGEVVPLATRNILPQAIDATVLGIIALIAIGVAIVMYIDRLDLVKEEHVG